MWGFFEDFVDMTFSLTGFGASCGRSGCPHGGLEEKTNANKSIIIGSIYHKDVYAIHTRIQIGGSAFGYSLARVASPKG